MIDVSDVVVKAYEGHDIHSELYKQSEDTKSFVAIFPGGNYSCDKPLLHYARKAALIAGHDVLCLSYGRKEPIKGLVDSIEVETQECYDAIRKCVIDNYKEIYFISKSLGTDIAGRISKELGYCKVNNLFLTPINTALAHVINSKCTVIIGTKDKVFSEENIDIIKKYSGVELLLIDGAKHSLELDNDLEGCLKILSQVTELYVKFLK